MLLVALAVSLLRKMLAGEGVVRAGDGFIRAGEEQIEPFRIFNAAHPLNSFKIQKYYQFERRFDGLYSRNNLPKIKYGAYVINLYEYESIGTHWIALKLKILQKKSKNL